MLEFHLSNSEHSWTTGTFSRYKYSYLTAVHEVDVVRIRYDPVQLQYQVVGTRDHYCTVVRVLLHLKCGAYPCYDECTEHYRQYGALLNVLQYWIACTP